MQLMKPYFTTVRSGGRAIPSSKRLEQKKAEHDAWLRKNGVHPEQLKPNKRGKLTLSYKTDSIKTSDTIVDGGRITGIMANIDKEPEHIKKQILEKAKRIEIAYNKGGLVYVTDGMDIKTMGSRSRRP
jgi:hypothetical protein